MGYNFVSPGGYLCQPLSIMFLRFDIRGGRLFVILLTGKRVGKTVRQEHLGMLGSVAAGEPVSLSDRKKLWSEMNERFRVLRQRHPGRISEADEIKIRNRVAKRIPRARNERSSSFFCRRPSSTTSSWPLSGKTRASTGRARRSSNFRS